MNRVLLAVVLGTVYLLIRGSYRRPDTAAAAALAAESARTGKAPGELMARSVTAETWPDAGLGLASPFDAYAQVLTPGYRVEVAHAGGSTVAEYHCDMAGRCLFCPPCSARLSGAAA